MQPFWRSQTSWVWEAVQTVPAFKTRPVMILHAPTTYRLPCSFQHCYMQVYKTCTHLCAFLDRLACRYNNPDGSLIIVPKEESDYNATHQGPPARMVLKSLPEQWRLPIPIFSKGFPRNSTTKGENNVGFSPLKSAGTSLGRYVGLASNYKGNQRCPLGEIWVFALVIAGGNR